MYELIMEYKLYIILLIATIGNYFWLSDTNNKKRLNINNNILIFVIALMHTVIGLLSVKFFAIVEVGFDMERAGNMSLYGGIFFMPLFYFVLAKITHNKLADVFDIFSISLISTLMLARFNCILSGCCLGDYFFDSSTLRWPTRETEILFYMIILFILEKNVSKNKDYGKAYPIFMLSYGIFRFINETFRVGEGLLHRSHYWSIVSIIIGIIILSIIKKCKKKEVNKNE